MNSLLSSLLGQMLLALLPILKEAEAKYLPQIIDLFTQVAERVKDLGLDLLVGAETLTEEKIGVRIKLDEVKVFALSLLTQIEVDGERLPTTILNVAESALGGAFGSILKIFGL